MSRCQTQMRRHTAHVGVIPQRQNVQPLCNMSDTGAYAFRVTVVYKSRSSGTEVKPRSFTCSQHTETRVNLAVHWSQVFSHLRPSLLAHQLSGILHHHYRQSDIECSTKSVLTLQEDNQPDYCNYLHRLSQHAYEPKLLYQNSCILAYHWRGDCFSPYSDFDSLQTLFLFEGSFSPSGTAIYISSLKSPFKNAVTTSICSSSRSW